MINVRRSLKSLNDAILKAHWNFHNYFSCVGVPRQYNTLWIFSQQVKKFRLCFQSWWYMPENAFNLYITRELPLKNLFKNLHFWLSAGTPYTWARTKIFWIWFICTLEGCVVLWTCLILKKVQIWNTLVRRQMSGGLGFTECSPSSKFNMSIQT